jgi:molybdate transport system regulatory protein
MKISARNVLAGTVEKVTKGAVNAEINLQLEGGEKVASIITNGSANALKLKKGAAAFAVIKASEVMIGTDLDGAKLSARNVLPGVVSKVQDGAVNSEVILTLPGGSKVVASITKTSVKSLGLKKGTKASAIIKASNVMVGV